MALSLLHTTRVHGAVVDTRVHGPWTRSFKMMPVPTAHVPSFTLVLWHGDRPLDVTVTVCSSVDDSYVNPASQCSRFDRRTSWRQKVSELRRTAYRFGQGDD